MGFMNESLSITELSKDLIMCIQINLSEGIKKKYGNMQIQDTTVECDLSADENFF